MEDEVLAAIKTLAVCKENTMVAHVVLYEMHQDSDESAIPNRSLQIPIKLPHLQH